MSNKTLNFKSNTVYLTENGAVTDFNELTPKEKQFVKLCDNAEKDFYNNLQKHREMEIKFINISDQ